MSMTERERLLWREWAAYNSCCTVRAVYLQFRRRPLVTPLLRRVMTTARRGGTPVTLSVSGDEITRPVAAADALFALLSLHLFVLWIPRWQIRWCARTHEVAVADHRRFSTRLSGALPHTSVRCWWMARLVSLGWIVHRATLETVTSLMVYYEKNSNNYLVHR